MKKKVKKVLKKELKGVTLLLAVLFLSTGCVLGSLVYNFMFKEAETKIELVGQNVCDINIGEEYQEEGYTFIINGADYSKEVEVSSKVNNNVAGTYVITYTLDSDGHNVVLTRIVNVIGGVSDGK